MKYQVAVYFAGPKTVWTEKMDESEVTMICDAPWLWVARSQARQAMGNTGRCGYVITKDGDLIEHVHATAAAVESIA